MSRRPKSTKRNVEYRQDRQRWGFRVSLNGKRYKRYQWLSEQEAEAAYAHFIQQARLPPTAFGSIARDYCLDTGRKRSKARYNGARYNVEKWLIPWFGEATRISGITSQDCERFVAFHKQRAVKNITIWHYVKDLRAILNYAIRTGHLKDNPLARTDLSAIRNRKALKLPLDLEAVARGLSCVKGRERLYCDVLRYMGLRKDEANKVRVEDVLDHGTQMWLRVRGTKTDESERVLAVPPALWHEMRSQSQGLEPTHYLLCNDTQGGQYDRRRLFRRISRAAGCRIVPKDLRDYFASVMDDPVVASKMLGHTGLDTTAIYVRQVQQRMQQGVANLGATHGGQLSPSNPPNDPKFPSPATQHFYNYLDSLTGRSAAW
jgi:integrase